MKLPTIPGIETFWRLKGRSVDGKEQVFTNEEATVTEATDQSCSWKFSTGMEVGRQNAKLFCWCDEYNTVFVDRCGKSGVEVPLERKEDGEGCG